MNRKMLPVLIMLVAGAVTCFATFFRDYTMLEKLVILFFTLLIFYLLGCILQRTLDYFDKQNELAREAALEEEQELTQAKEKTAKEQA